MVAEVKTAKEYFATLPERFNAAALQRGGVRYKFDLDGRKQYIVSVMRDSVKVQESGDDTPTDLALNLPEFLLVEVANGRTTFGALHQRGVLKLAGDPNGLKQLQAIFPGRRA